MKKQNQYYVEEREIDVKRMLVNALSYWRFILIIAVIAAVLLGVKQYRSDVASAKASIQAQIDAINAPERTIEYVESLLGTTEVQTVRNAADFMALSMQKREYLDESLWMNLDGYDEDVIYLTYYTVGGASNPLINVGYYYASGTEIAADIVEDLGLTVDSMYIMELVSVTDTDWLNYFKVKVCADTSEECEALADSVNKAILNYVEENLPVSDPLITLTLAAKESDIIVDEAQISRKSTYAYDIVNLNNNYNSLYNSFNATQHELLALILEENAAKESSIYETSAEEEDTADAKEAEKQAAIAAVDTTIHVRPSVKAILIGFLAGAIIAYALCALRYSISKSIHGEDEMKYLFQTPIFGTVTMAAFGKKRFGAAVDTMIEKAGCGRRKYLNSGQQIQMIYSNILIACKNRELTKVVVSGSEIERIPEKFLAAVKEKLAADGITLEYNNSILYDAKALLAMSENGYGIFFEVAEKSKCEEIARELTLCIQNQITVLGVVLAQ